MIIVAGGGIAGLSLAWALCRAGVAVTLLERNKIGSGASRAAAAYLEPRFGTGHLRALERASFEAWPDYAAALESASGQSIDYRTEGQLRIAYGDNHDEVKADLERRLGAGWHGEWVTGKALRELEPNLSGEVVAGAYLRDVHWLDARATCAALAQAIRSSGGRIHEDCDVRSLIEDRGRVTGCITSRGKFIADKIVLCAGLGVNDIGGLPKDVAKSRPVKGVMLHLATDNIAPVVRRLIKRPDGIICPRSDGRLLVGATHEEGETSLIASSGAIDGLMCSAVKAVPAIADLPLLEAACGIRSLIGDGLMRLGCSGGVEGLYYSLSHAGAGFLRAPVVSRELAAFILDHDAPCQMIDRFLRR